MLMFQSSTEANAQTTGIPGNFQAKHTGFASALQYYRDNYPTNVKKFVEDAEEWVDASEDVMSDAASDDFAAGSSSQ